MNRYNGTLLVKAAWHLLVVAAILLLPNWIAFHELPRASMVGDFWTTRAAAAAYVLAILSSEVGWRFLRLPRVVVTVAVGAVCISAILFGLTILTPAGLSRRVLIAALAITAAGLVASPLLLHGRGRSRALGLVAALLLLAPLVKLAPPPTSPTETVRASHQMLTITRFPNLFPAQTGTVVKGGAIAYLGRKNEYLVARPRGELYRIESRGAKKPLLHDLQMRVPINNAEFEKDIGGRASTWNFRVADIAVRLDAAAPRVYASHHFWKHDQQCFVLRVSSHELAPDFGASSAGRGDWQTLYESIPCLPIAPARGPPFAGEQVGGNLEFLDEHTLLLTVGDNQFDGFYRSPDYVSDPTAHYGKTVTIDTETGHVEIFTRGHRNPEGLLKDSKGRVWLTEHGPQGGDELNLLVKGGDYGYPYTTYGTEYGSTIWPPEEAAGDRKGSIPPVYAWVPSTAISDLVEITDPAFPKWRNDLLIGSLGWVPGQKLWRVRVLDDRVVYAEPIQIGERIRDLAAGSGEFLLYTDAESLIRVSPATDLGDGAALFALHCGGCHDYSDHDNFAIGPGLGGVVGRRVGSIDGYHYSEAMKRFDGQWTEERLDAFLKSPASFMPGTGMAFEGIADARERRVLIDYLKSR